MIYWLLWCFMTILMDVFATLKVAQNEKDLEIIMLRQQVRILQRKISSSPRISKPEKLILTALTYQMKQTTAGFHNCLQRCLLLFKPDTLLKWHRELVKRKWTFRRRKQGGRPRGPWRISRSPALSYAFPNVHFALLGLPTLTARQYA